MSSTKTLIEYLTKNFGEYHLICGETITYLEAIMGDLGNHIIICRKDISQTRGLKNFLKPENSENGDDLNLTGSPLKDIFEMDEFSLNFSNLKVNPWNYEEEAYIGINRHEARKIICNYNFQKIASVSNTTVWVLCDADDVDKTIFMSSEDDPEYDGGGIISYCGITATTIDTEELMKTHFKIIDSQEGEIFVENIFHVDSNISFKVSWESSFETPEMNFYCDADVTLIQSVNVVSSGSVIESFWNELHLLSNILESIIDYQNNDHDEPVYSCEDGLDEEELQKKIMNIMLVLTKAEYAESSIEISRVIQNRKNQHSDGITDRLWNVLKQCSSYKHLKRSLEHIFQLAVQCNNNLPVNKNRLANMITELCNGCIEIPSLAGSEPIELLLEIGLEKLYRDYEYILVESNICSAQGFKDLLKEENDKTVEQIQTTANSRKSLFKLKEKSSSAEKLSTVCKKYLQQTNWKKMLMKLVRVHLSLEHILLLQSHFQIEKVQRFLFQQLMKIETKSIQELINDVYHRISIPFTAYKMLDHFVLMTPSSRKIVISSKTECQEAKHIYYYNMEYIFPNNTFKGISSTIEQLDLESKYHLWKYLKIKWIRFQRVSIEENLSEKEEEV